MGLTRTVAVMAATMAMVGLMASGAAAQCVNCSAGAAGVQVYAAPVPQPQQAYAAPAPVQQYGGWGGYSGAQSGGGGYGARVYVQRGYASDAGPYYGAQSGGGYGGQGNRSGFFRRLFGR